MRWRTKSIINIVWGVFLILFGGFSLGLHQILYALLLMLGGLFIGTELALWKTRYYDWLELQGGEEE